MRIFVKICIIGFLISIYGCSNTRSVKYEYVGKFKYKITNESLFSETYLSSDSYGYLIGDLQIQGIEIINIESLDVNNDYIISLDHPVRAVYNKSKKIDGEGNINTKKIPLDIIVDSTICTKNVYIYKLFQKNKYRLILP